MKNKNLFCAILFFFIMSMSWISPVRAGMIKTVAMGLYLNAPSQADADRFYLRYHGPEAVYKNGPWLRRYVLYLGHEPPSEAVERFGAVGGRYCEEWWGSIEELNSRPLGGAFTIEPWEEDIGQRGPKGPTYVTRVPAVPTEIFYDPSPNPEKTSIIRWVQVIRYPEGVSVEEGEKWFLEVHAKEALKQPGLLKFISHRCIDYSKLRKMYSSSEDGIMTPLSTERIQWIRLNEYWYKNFDDWRRAVIESPPKYTTPSWGGEYPFVEMGSTFIDYKWDVDLLKGDYIIP